MERFENTQLYRQLLADQGPNDTHRHARDSYRAVVANVRSKAAELGIEIHRDLPNFTPHDVSHADRLWELVDQLIGPEDLNPYELALLGVAIYIHDLGMGVAAYAGTQSDIRGLPEWADTVALLGKQKLGRTLTPQEVADPPGSIAQAATRELLRSRHATKANDLGSAKWHSKVTGETVYLIENLEFRHSAGHLVGVLAASHGQSLDWLEAKSAPIVGTPFGPADWSARPLLIGALLRCADALHLDASRAPHVLAATRSLPDVSQEHWRFQSKLQKPDTRDELVVFSSTPFKPDEASAWWLCFDTLSWVDRELRETERFLRARNLPRLRARGVSGVEAPAALSKYVRTSNWSPVDTSLRVSDVADLIERLGGRQLYGDDIRVPIRELIQNARDACQARTSLEGGKARITVRSSGDVETQEWLEVSDSGIGMTERGLTDDFLNFGSSYWNTHRAIEESPGLLSSTFEPAGKYGIGFFSVFMIGDRIDVITRHRNDGRSDTRVLSFEGLRGRPFIRDARDFEVLDEPGTCVRVLLDGPVLSASVLSGHAIDGETARARFKKLVASIAPMLDVDLYVQYGDGPVEICVRANDWASIASDELLYRLDREEFGLPPDGDLVSRCFRNLREVHDDVETVTGRLAIVPHDVDSFAPRGLTGSVCVGGLHATQMPLVWGLCKGVATRAARDQADPCIALPALSAWASEQATVVGDLTDSPTALLRVANLVVACDGDPGVLPVALTVEGPLSTLDLRKLIERAGDELVVAQLTDDWLSATTDKLLYGNAVLAYSHPPEFTSHVSDVSFTPWPPQTEHYVGAGASMEIVLRSISECWSVDLSDLAAEFHNQRAPGSVYLGRPVEVAPGRRAHGVVVKR